MKSTHERSGAGGGNRTRRLRCGAPVCRRNTSPAWRSRYERDLFFESTWAPGGTSDDSRVGRVGIEPTFRRIKNPLQGLRLLPTPGTSSHPLESNQNLSGFNRARRPTTQEWDVTLRAPAGRRSVLSWVPCQAPSSSSLFGCQRSQVARAAVRRTHLGPCGARTRCEHTCRGTRSGLRSPDHESQSR